jgi:2,4-dienoyl-CoA reductase-like NADH-dependent reductase (Old Yellow Enzyme family)
MRTITTAASDAARHAKEYHMTITRRATLKMLGTGALAAGLLPLTGAARAATRRGLFDATTIGGMKLKNRIVRASTSMEMADGNGNPTPRLLAAYGEVARGGASLVVTGMAYVMEQDQLFHSALGFHSDEQIPAFRELAEVIRANGSKSCLQIGFAGSVCGYKVGEREIWGPSAVEHPFTKVTPKAMTKEDIGTAVRALADASVRAREAGFDCIELHFVHNFMLNQFLVPFFNRRTDEYGGAIENRARIHFEIMEAVRAATGPDYPVIAKIHGQDYLEKDGMTLDEGIHLARGLVDRGVTALEVSGGNLISTPQTLPIRPGIDGDPALQTYFAEDARAMDAALDVPLILTGGNRDPKVMQAVLDTNADVVAFGLCRTLLSEPDLPDTWKADPAAQPQCVSCNECIMNYGTRPTVCVLNA